MCRQQATAVDVLRKPIDGRIGNFQVERGAPWQDAPDVVAIGWRQIEHTFAWYFSPPSLRGHRVEYAAVRRRQAGIRHPRARHAASA
jgi:hypothetical protein